MYVSWSFLAKSEWSKQTEKLRRICLNVVSIPNPMWLRLTLRVTCTTDKKTSLLCLACSWNPCAVSRTSKVPRSQSTRPVPSTGCSRAQTRARAHPWLLRPRPRVSSYPRTTTTAAPVPRTPRTCCSRRPKMCSCLRPPYRRGGRYRRPLRKISLAQHRS